MAGKTMLKMYEKINTLSIISKKSDVLQKYTTKGAYFEKHILLIGCYRMKTLKEDILNEIQIKLHRQYCNSGQVHAFSKFFNLAAVFDE